MDQIGRYKLEAELGRGGCGRVYRAFDPTVGRTVAIKLLITNTDKELLTRFRNEASASGKLHHRNIVTVYDFGEQDGTPYLVMEYLQGEDLHKLSAKGQQLTLIEKMSIMAQVAEGLHHAHQNGIVHRDVKPANIMVLSDGSVKIMDFGIARLLSQTGTRLTRDGAMIGTVSYMAPEQFQGGEIDALCDIWAYGLIYYELVTGYHPFNAPEPGIAIYNITAVDPPPVRAFVHDCPPALEDIIMRAIRKDRNLRYQSLEDVQFDVAPIRLELQRERADHLMIAAEEKFTVKDVTGAQLLIREILDLDPSNVSARRLRETINRESEMRVIRERTTALKAVGTAELAAEQYAKAVQTFESALRLDPQNTELQTLLQQAREGIDKTSRAAVLLVQARHELRAHHLTNAHRSVMECLQNTPRSQQANDLLVAIQREIEVRDRERRLNESLTAVDALIRDEQYDEALRTLVELEASYPESQKVKETLAAVHLGIEERLRKQRLAQGVAAGKKLIDECAWQPAIDWFTTLRDDFPRSDEIPPLLAHAEERLREQKKSEHVERIAAEARTLTQACEFERAIDVVESGLRAYPDEPVLGAIRDGIAESQTAHERQVGIRTAEEAALRLLAAKLFDDADAEIDRALQSWDDPQLHALKQRIAGERQEYERSEAITRVSAEVQALIRDGKIQDALDRAQLAVKEFGDAPELNELVGTAAASKRAKVDSVMRDAAQLAEAFEFDGAIALLMETSHAFSGEDRLRAEAEALRLRQLEHHRSRAEELIQNQRLEEAARFLEESLQRYGGDVPLNAMLTDVRRDIADQKRTAAVQAAIKQADAHARDGDFENAITALHRLDAVYRSDPQVIAKLAAIHTERAVEQIIRQVSSDTGRRHFDSALKAVERGLQDYPQHQRLTAIRQDTIAAHNEFKRERAILTAIQKAGRLRAKADLDGAIQIVEAALRSVLDEPRLLAEQASLRQEIQRRKDLDNAIRAARELAGRGQFDEAQQSLDAARKVYGDQSQIASVISDVQKAKRVADINNSAARIDVLLASDPDEAARRAEQALRTFPNEPKLLDALRRCRESLEQRRREADAQARATQAQRLLEAHKFDEAVALLETANAEYPRHSELSKLLKAAVDAQQAQRRAEAIESVIQRAGVLLESAKYTDAQELVSSAVGEHGSDERLLSLLTKIQTEKRQFEEEQAIKTIVEEAEVLADHHKFSDAAQMLAAALRKHPNEARLLDSQSRTEARRRHHERALRIASAIRQAREHLEQDRPNLAVSLLQPIVHDANSDADVRHLFDLAQAKAAEQARDEQIRHIMHEAESAGEQKNYSDAARYIEAGLSTFPDSLRLTAMRAELERLMDIERQQEELLAATRAVEDVPAAPEPIVEEPRPVVVEHAVEHVDESVPSLPPATHPQPVPALSVSAAAPSPALTQPVPAGRSQTDSDTLELQKLRPPPPWRLVAAGLAGAFVIAIAAFLFMRGASKPPGLSVRTVPAGATIRIAGKTCSQEPCTFDIPAGKHDIEVTLPGYRAIREPIVFDKSHTQHMFTMEPLATRLQVVTNLSEGTVLVDGRPAGTLKAGEFQLEPVPVGWHTLQVNSNDVASASLRFEAVAGRAPQIEKTVEGKEVQAVAVSNLGQEARLVSTGTGSVIVDGRSAGELTGAGLVLGNLGPGTHTVRLQAGRDGLDYVIATGDVPSLSVFMTANRDVGSLVVETREDDVRVFVNGERWPRPSQQGIVRINNLPVREHSIRVEKPGFKSPTPQRVAVSKGTLQRISFRLEPLPATLVLSGAMPQTQLLLDGRPIGTAQGNTRFPIAPGAHVLRLTRDGYVPKEIPLRVDPGGTFNLARNDLLLKEVPPPSPPPAKPTAPPATVAEAPKPVEPPKTEDLRPPDVREWEQVQNSKDINRLEQFRKTYPKSPLSETAAHRIEAIEWESVRGSNDPKILQEFLTRHPKGEHSDEVRRRVEQLEWAAVGRDNPESLRAFLRRFPTSDHAAEAKSLLSKVDETQDVAAIRQALDRYSSAMSAKDVDEVTRIWKNAPTRLLTEQFKILRESSVQMRLVSWKIEGDRATVQCLRTSTAHLAAKPRPEPPRTDPATVTLRRQGGAWVIEDVQAGRAR